MASSRHKSGMWRISLPKVAYEACTTPGKERDLGEVSTAPLSLDLKAEMMLVEAAKSSVEASEGGRVK